MLYWLNMLRETGYYFIMRANSKKFLSRVGYAKPYFLTLPTGDEVLAGYEVRRDGGNGVWTVLPGARQSDVDKWFGEQL